MWVDEVKAFNLAMADDAFVWLHSGLVSLTLKITQIMFI